MILDPPKFGRGPKGEVWEFYKLIPELLQPAARCSAEQPRFVLLTAYAVKASALTLHYALEEMMAGCHGQTDAGEIVLEEKSAGRRSPPPFLRAGMNEEPCHAESPSTFALIGTGTMGEAIIAGLLRDGITLPDASWPPARGPNAAPS